MASEKTSYRFQKLPPEVVGELCDENDRATRAVMRLIGKWPNYRREIAVELLGAATATAETFGVDAVAAVIRIVSHCGKPDQLIPPKGS